MPISFIILLFSILSLIAFYCHWYPYFYQLPEKCPLKSRRYAYFLYYTAFLHTITGCFLLSLVSPFLSVAEKIPFKVKHYTYFLYYTAFLHTITGCFLLSPVFLFLSVAEKIPFKVKTLCLFPLLYCFSPYYHWLLSIVTGIPIFISCRKNAL